MLCTMHEDEIVTGAVVVEFNYSGNNSRKKHFESLSECRSGRSGANVPREIVPDCRGDEREGPFSNSLSVCTWHAVSEKQVLNEDGGLFSR